MQPEIDLTPMTMPDQAKTILIVDEALDKLKLLFDYLRGFGFKILIAMDGASAVAQAETLQPDIILLEATISGMDGFEICWHLKANDQTQHIPVIFTTDRAHPIDKVRGLKYGAVAYLIKPLQCEEVLAHVTTHLSHHQDHQQLKLQNLQLQTAQEQLEAQLTEQALEFDQINNRLLEETARREAAEGNIQTYQSQFEANNEVVAHLDQLKSEFLANTSHQIVAPLNGIIGIAESMLDGATGRLTPEQMHNLMMIVFSGRRLTSLINDTRDFAKLKYQDLNLDLKAVDIYSVAEVVLTMSQSIIGQKSLKLVNELHRELPAVSADESRVQQILYNLVGNAIKFTEVGNITISAVVEKDMLAITVSDTGIGIPPDRFDLIFQSLEQDDTAKEETASLGLFITKELVELHGGKIRLESTLDQGTDFTFTLPLHKWPVNASILNQAIDALTIDSHLSTNGHFPSFEPEPAFPLPSQNGSNRKETTILVVDDELISVQILTNYLSMQNFTVAQAFDGIEALEAVEAVKPDLILLDLMMPRMSGYDVCAKIREQYPTHQLPIILLTAKSQTADLVAGFEVGANDYLTKPFDKNELLVRVKTHLRLAKINTAYGRFVPHEILRFLDKESIEDVKLGDQVQREMTMLFSDIRAFTTLSENMTPHETFSFLNDYLGRVSPVIRQHHGFIDKYIGDAIMALFPRTTEDAVQAAVELQQKVTEYNAFHSKQGLQPIRVGIGLHTGLLMLGTIGETERMEGTVIADAVNLASRLEGLTKLYGASIIISEHSLLKLPQPDKYHTRSLGRVKVKGKKRAVSIFEIFDSDSAEMIDLKLETLTRFEMGLRYFYERHFDEASAQFEHVLQVNPDDKAAAHYLKRTTHFQTMQRPSPAKTNPIAEVILPHPLISKRGTSALNRD